MRHVSLRQSAPCANTSSRGFPPHWTRHHFPIQMSRLPTRCPMTVLWQPFREPLRNTVLRTGLIALAGGAALSFWWGGIARWPVAFLIVLWFSLGGHFVELFFLNFLRPRFP